MEVVPFTHEGLGNTAYLLPLGEGDAALIDPCRTIEAYLAAARERGLQIRAVLETHLHADFVTGSVECASATGAQVFVPEAAAVQFPHRAFRPGDRLRFGTVEIEALASPGHTPEHVSYVARSDRGPPTLFSGGSLIVGGAARTDLIDPSATEELTRRQYRTLRAAFHELPDDTALLPTHGGGSFCSVGDRAGRTSTLGDERMSNPLLRIEDENEFARSFPATFPAAPSYFARMRPMNQRGPRLRRDVPMPPALDPEQFVAVRGQAMVVDTRSMDDFARGHVAGAVSIPLRSAFAVWLGWLVPAGSALAFVVHEGSLEQVIQESMLVGSENFAGWLTGGMGAWIDAGFPISTTAMIDARQAHQAVQSGAVLIDVREQGEYGGDHLPGAIHIPLGEINARADDLPGAVPLIAYCGRGERASSAASLLERAGFEPVLTLPGGVAAWKEAGYPVEQG